MELLDARAEIADLIHTYALNIRSGKAGDCVKLFTEDAIFEVREAILGSSGNSRTRAQLAGHEAIRGYLAQANASGARVCPLIHNLLIRVNGREAASSCVMTTFIWPQGQQMIGEYQDRYRNENGWRFSARVFTILGEFKPGGTG